MRCGAALRCVWVANIVLMLMLMLLLILLPHFQVHFGLKFHNADVCCVSLPVLLNATGNSNSNETLIDCLITFISKFLLRRKIDICNQYQYTHALTGCYRLAIQIDSWKIRVVCLLATSKRQNQQLISRAQFDKIVITRPVCFFLQQPFTKRYRFFVDLLLVVLTLYIYGA